MNGHTMPEHVDIGDGLVLERATIAHAHGVAQAVGESLEHLHAFMPWADEHNARESVQYTRLLAVERLWADGREHQYAITPTSGADATDPAEVVPEHVVGMIGVMRTDRWDVGHDTVEIGYWVHPDWCNRGIATRASRALASAALTLDGVERVVIAVDEVNGPSNAVPRKLGYAVDKVVERPPAAPGESGRMRIWVLDARA